MEEELKVHFGLLQAAYVQHDRRLVARVVKHLGPIRKKLNREAVVTYLSFYSSNLPLNTLLGVRKAETAAADSTVPTQEAFVYLLALKFLQDTGEQHALKLSQGLIQQVLQWNLRELDPILARLLSAHVILAQKARQPAAIHNELMAALRSAQLRHDRESFAAAHNGLARVYLLTFQWDMMDRLFRNCPFPEDVCSHNQSARHFYYLARLAAVKLDYNSGFEGVETALRKAPTTSRCTSFRSACLKLLVVLKLLRGEIPELRLFRDNRLPQYYALAKAVRNGDLPGFQSLLSPDSPSAAVYQRDALEGLILRLHQNVLKAGLKRINIAYSHIPIADVAAKLGLAETFTDADVQMVVRKAIRDEVIGGQVSSDGRMFESTKSKRQYHPDVFHSRILACQSLIQEAVKAMQFPEKTASGSDKKKDASQTIEDTIDEEEQGEMIMMDEEYF